MTTHKDAESQREIIIVRRGGNQEEDAHHGGVWKIAFADFMTAMMCFFLVMWLVNAANEQTKVAVASYFNPVKLVDRNVNRKGIDTSGQTSTEAGTDSKSEPEPSTAEPQATTQTPAQRFSDDNLFADPYAVLAEIAEDTATLQNVSTRGEGGAQTSGPATGANGGEMYRDPFAPDFWSQQVAEPDIAAPQDTTALANSEVEGPQAESDVPVTDPAAGRPFETAPPEAGEIAAEQVALALPAGERFAAEDEDPFAPQPLAAMPASPNDEILEQTPGERTAELAETLRRELSEAFGQDDALNKTISVTARRTGVLISLTDELNYGMFEIGSAVPQRELVLAMEKIGAAIAAREGPVAIMGHTDGRPFRSGEYDNWRLSSARAHSAYYMLVRAGLPEQRVGEIAGHADRQLKVTDDPFADANRRIEIFLEVPG
jgi:chemotaxis protein MotB